MCTVQCYRSIVFFFKQKTAYEMRISDWSSDVCSSDLLDSCVRRSRARPGSAIAALGAVEQFLVGQHQRHHRFDHRHAANADAGVVAALGHDEIGRASCRERVCHYVSISGVAVSLKKKKRYEHSDEITIKI